MKKAIKHKKYVVIPPIGYIRKNGEPMLNYELRHFAKDMPARDNDTWTDWDEMVWGVDIKEIVKMLKQNGFDVKII